MAKEQEQTEGMRDYEVDQISEGENSVENSEKAGARFLSQVDQEELERKAQR